VTDKATTTPLLPECSAPAACKPARSYFLRDYGDGLFTGAKLAEIDPNRYEKVKELIADGRLSRRQIAQIVGVSPNTVRAIEDSCFQSIDALRARLAAMCASIEGATLDRIREALEDPDNAPTLRDLAAILREVGNRSDLLAGRPTSIVGHEAGSVEDMVQANAARRAQLRAIKAVAELVTEPTRLEVGNGAPTPEQGAQAEAAGADPEAHG
jgi:hypothetical protein